MAAGINRDISWDNSITLTNLHVTGSAYGGLIVSSNTNVALPVAASQIAQKYYVGSTPYSVRQAILYGSTSITIENGNYTNVFGGGAGYGSVVTGDTEINWQGNNVNNIYGGGDIGSVVEGDTNVNIIGNSTGNAYYGYYTYGGRISKIYGGGKNSTVMGDSNVTFSSDAALINFTGTVYGSGEGKNSIVKGSRNLVFDNYSNDFKATIIDFTNISFEVATSVTLTRAQNKSVIGATYEFDINEDSLKNTKAMLVWNMNNVKLNNVVVTIGTSSESLEPQKLDKGASIDLISSKYFVNDSSFDVKNVLVLNDEGNSVSKFLYDINYRKYDKKTKEGGLVSIDYKGTADLVLDGTETEKVVLTGRSDEVNLVAGGHLAYGLETAGGNDTVNVQSGAIINGTIYLGAGNDTLCIQTGTVLNGCIYLGLGDDHMVVATQAVVNCDVSLGAGRNDLTVQNHAMITGTVRFADGSENMVSDNSVIINGGAISSFAGGNEFTNNTLVVNGSRLYLPILDTFVLSGGIGYYQNVLPNSIDIGGIVGTTPVDLSLSVNDENWILSNMFVAQDLNLGASNDTVTFNSYAQVMNINLGAGDDKLTLNEEAIVRGDINLGSGDNVLVLNCGNVFNGRLIENLDGTVVVVAGTNMELDGDKLGLGSTNNVLVVTKGAQVEVEGGSMGRFLTSDNDDIYLCQNAIISFTDFDLHTEYIQNYTGYLTVDGDLEVMAESKNIPDQIAPYYKITTPGGVVNSEINVEDDFTLREGANLTGSTVKVGKNAVLSGTVAGSALYIEGDAFVDGTVASATIAGVTMRSLLDVDGNVNIAGTVSDSIIAADGVSGGNIFIGGTVSNSVINASGHVDIAGKVSGTAVVADAVEFFGNTDFTGSISAGDFVKFNNNFESTDLVVSTREIKIEENVEVMINALTPADADGDSRIDYDFEVNAILVEMGNSLITIGDTTEDIAFMNNYSVSIRGEVSADMALSNNTISLDEGENGYGHFLGNAYLSGINTLVINDDDWYDWQQFVFSNEDAKIGFDIADYKLLAIDGYLSGPQINTVLDMTNFGQNSQLAIGSCIYIQDWKDSNDERTYTLPVNPFIDGSEPICVTWENLNVTAGAEIWGGIQLDNDANRLIIAEGVVINGGVYYYDYATIQTLGGDDFIEIQEATINGQIDTGTTLAQGLTGVSSDDDILSLNGTNLNAAVNQGVPVITMGWGDDQLYIADSIVASSTVNGDISLGGGDDSAFVRASTVNGTIDLGEGGNDFEIISSTIGDLIGDAIVGGSGADDGHVSASTINGDIELGAGDNELEILAGSTLNGDIELGIGDDEVEINSSTVNGSIELGSGDNELDIVASSAVGLELPVGPFDSSVSAVAIIGGDNADYVYVRASTVNGGIELGDGENDLYIMAGSTITGDIELGNDSNDLDIYSSIVTGDIDLGNGKNEVSLRDSTVNGDIRFGSISDLFEPVQESDNILAVDNVTVNGNVNMFGTENILNVDGAFMINSEIEPLIFVFGIIQGDGLFMAAESNNINFGEVASLNLDADGADYFIIISGAQDITMFGAYNSISTHEYGDEYKIGYNETFTVGNISNQITANALTMISFGSGETTSNMISFGVEAEVDGTYDPVNNLHKISSLELGSTTMTLSAPITMLAAGVTAANLIDMDYELHAEGEGDIAVTGNTDISMIGGITMMGFENSLSANIDFTAANQAKVDVGENDVALLIDGDITMLAGDVSVALLIIAGQEGVSGSNEISLGCLDNTIGSRTEDGEIIANGSYTVTVDGSIVMGGIGVTNTMTIERNVTVNGNIIMGLVNGGPMDDTDITGDDLALSNELTVNDPESFNIDGTIVLTARSNTVNFNGVGDVTGLASIYGGSNSLYVAEGVTINDIVSFGGVYDADHIGIEGYLIQANTDNQIDIHGTVRGIDTSIDLAGPTGAVNASEDDIDIYGTVTEGITTGNGDDDVDIHGGHVGGNIVMGDRASGATGSNDLFIQATEPTVELAILSGAATVDGNVTMETTSTNRLAMEGLVVTDFSDMLIPETVYRATIGGNVLMNAIDGLTGGANTVLLGDGFHESATTIAGDVTMNAGASNTVTVDTGWLYEFDEDGSHDAASYVNSFIAMATEGDNTLEVEHGTFVIGATAGDGISMRQDLFKEGGTGGDNLIDVDEEARLVMTSDVRMGNTVDDILVYGAYDYLDVTITGNIETYHFIWSDDVPGTLFDTVENTINVDGKMFAGNIVMTASDNDIFLSGPARVPWTAVAATEAGIMTPPGATGAIMDVDNITMNGWTNTIKIEGHTGAALFDSGNIIMSWGAGVTGGTFIDAKTNTITNDADSETLFRSGSISMFASNENRMTIFGMIDAEGAVTKSTVTGDVNMVTTALAGVTTDNGINSAVLIDTDITGNLNMTAGGGVSGLNVLDLFGSITGVSGTVVTESNISGNVAMTTDVGVTGATYAGLNVAVISLGNIGGNVDMKTLGAAGDNILMVLGGATGGVTYTSDIGGGINMDSNAGYNQLNLFSATVGDVAPLGITMDAGNYNWAKLTGSTVTGNIVQTAGDWNYLSVDPSTVDGGITMEAETLNDLYVLGEVSAGVTGVNEAGDDILVAGTLFAKSIVNDTVEMTANDGSNYATFFLSDVFDSITLTAEEYNQLDVGGTYMSEITGLVSGVPAVLQSSMWSINTIDGDVDMTSNTNSNRAVLYLVDISGDLTMTLNTKSWNWDMNYLIIQGQAVPAGLVEPAFDIMSHIDGSISMMINGQGYNTMLFDRVELGAGLTMETNATRLKESNGDNYAIIENSEVAGGVDVNALGLIGNNSVEVTDSTISGGISTLAVAGSNILWIDPSKVNGNVGMTAGIGNTFAMFDGTVIGDVTMFAAEDGNTFGMFDSGVTGDITMSSTHGSNAFGFGEDSGYAGFTASSLSHITGDVHMTAGISGASGGSNIMFQLGVLDGSLVMGATADGFNELGIGGTVMGGVTLTSVITDGVNMSTNSGYNWLNLEDYASISGGVTMMTGVSGTSEIIVASTSSIAGGVVTGDGNDGITLGGSLSGGVTMGAGDDDLNVFAGATLTGTINMGAGANTIDLSSDPMVLTIGTGVTFTFSDINTGGAAGTIDIGGFIGNNGNGFINYGSNDVGYENLAITGGFGSNGSTMTVHNTIERLVFVGVSGDPIDVAGTLDTFNGNTGGMIGTVNIFDASGMTGGTLITAANGTSWDILDGGGTTGAVELIGDSSMVSGDSVTLVSGYAVNLDNWHNGGINTVALEVDNTTYNMTWVSDHYEAMVGINTWELTDETNTALKLGIANNG